MIFIDPLPILALANATLGRLNRSHIICLSIASRRRKSATANAPSSVNQAPLRNHLYTSAAGVARDLNINYEVLRR